MREWTRSILSKSSSRWSCGVVGKEMKRLRPKPAGLGTWIIVQPDQTGLRSVRCVSAMQGIDLEHRHAMYAAVLSHITVIS